MDGNAWAPLGAPAGPGSACTGFLFGGRCGGPWQGEGVVAEGGGGEVMKTPFLLPFARPCLPYMSD